MYSLYRSCIGILHRPYTKAILVAYTDYISIKNVFYFQPRGKPRLELGVQRLWNYVDLFWNSLDNAPSSIAFNLEMKVDVEVGVHNIRSRFTPHFQHYGKF